MAYLTGDGVTTYATAQIPGRYTVLSAAATVGSPGVYGTGQYISVAASGSGLTGCLKLLPAAVTTTIIWSGRIYIANATPAVTLLVFLDPSFGIQGTLSVDGTGALKYISGSNTYASSAGSIPQQSWQRLQILITLSDSGAGVVTVNLGTPGTQILHATSATTAVTTAGVGSYFLQGFGNGPVRFADMLVMDTTTAVNNAFFTTDPVAVPHMPSANGRVNNFGVFPGSDQNWQAVDEIPPDGDTSFVFSSNIGDIDAYQQPSFTGSATIYAVNALAYARIDSAGGSRTLAVGVGNGSTETFGTGMVFASTSYLYAETPLNENPETSAPWAAADFSTLQVAIKVTA